MRHILLASVLGVAVTAGIAVMVEAQAPRPATKKPAQTQPAATKPAPPQQVAATEDRGEESSGNFFKDSWLTSKVKAKIFADKRVKGMSVSVETRNSVVMLRGKVATAEARRAAEETARGTDGVKSVVNALQVVPEGQRKAVDAKDDEIKKAVKTRLEADGALADADISVRSDNAVVTLMGTVPDARTGARAAGLARRVPGVKSVRNEIQPKAVARAK